MLAQTPSDFDNLQNTESQSRPSEYKSIIQEQSEQYNKYGALSDEKWDSVQYTLSNKANISNAAFKEIGTTDALGCVLNKRVVGYHPYWIGTAHTKYNWSLLSELCYFDYTIDPLTGNNSNAAFQYLKSPAVTAAIANGVKTTICVTLFSKHNTFLASAAAQQTFINNIISLLKQRGGKGVNIDFEQMASTNKVAFNAFIKNVNTQLKKAIKGAELTLILYAVDWSNLFDIPNLNPNVDYFLLMGYDYFYSGSTFAGPVDPLYSFPGTYTPSLAKSVNDYTKKGVPTSKLILGLPYYGREWKTKSLVLGAATTGAANSFSRTLAYIKNNPATYNATTKKWEANSFTPYYNLNQAGVFSQCYINDVKSLGARYDLINNMGLAGAAIWTLGMDDGMSDYWNLISTKLSNCKPIVCTDTIYDLGGPNGNYYDNADYQLLISAPKTTNALNLSFRNFDLDIRDTVLVYNGNASNAPLIGKYTGLKPNFNVSALSGFARIRFKANATVNKKGWQLIWSCIPKVGLKEIGDSDELVSEYLYTYPNPTNSDMVVAYNTVKDENISINLIDMLGRNITISNNLFTLKGDYTLNLNLNAYGLANGIYTLLLQTGDSQRVFRVEKQ